MDIDSTVWEWRAVDELVWEKEDFWKMLTPSQSQTMWRLGHLQHHQEWRQMGDQPQCQPLHPGRLQPRGWKHHHEQPGHWPGGDWSTRVKLLKLGEDINEVISLSDQDDVTVTVPTGEATPKPRRGDRSRRKPSYLKDYVEKWYHWNYWRIQKFWRRRLIKRMYRVLYIVGLPAFLMHSVTSWHEISGDFTECLSFSKFNI